jgi:hypothetical protein
MRRVHDGNLALHADGDLSASCVTADTMIAPAETSVVTKAM